MLKAISGNLELFIMQNCSFYDCDEKSSEVFLRRWSKEGKRLPSLHFPKLNTLILYDVEVRSRFLALLIIRAENMIELGLITWASFVDEYVAKLFVDLIKVNRKLKLLHVPATSTAVLIEDALKHPKLEHEFEELSLFFDLAEQENERLTFEMVINFLETQRKLKSLCLYRFTINENDMRSLLSLPLKRLELCLCSLQPSQNTDFVNNSIESLLFIGFHIMEDTTNHVELYKLIDKCKNLSALSVYVEEPGEDLLTKFERWKTIDTTKRSPESMSWADLRSLRYGGAHFFIEVIRIMSEEFLIHDNSGNLPADRHPCSIIKFERKLERNFGDKFWFELILELISIKVCSILIRCKEILGRFLYHLDEEE